MTSPGTPATPATAPEWQLRGVKKVRVHHLRQAKAAGQRITMLTAYDAVTGRLFDEAGIDMLLVGDSMGNTMLATPNTIPVTLDEMIVATRSVSRVAQRAMVVADLPFGSYEASPQQCHASSVRLLKEAGAHAVKLEGGRHMTPQVRLLTSTGIPVVGHLGFTPQSENTLGGHRVQGRGDAAEEALLADALALQEAGVCSIVFEMVPQPVATRVSAALEVPTIGIGAGPGCDGQVLVWVDMAGMGDWSPRFAKQFGHLGPLLRQAAEDYAAEVRDGTFPDDAHSFAS